MGPNLKEFWSNLWPRLLTAFHSYPVYSLLQMLRFDLYVSRNTSFKLIHNHLHKSRWAQPCRGLSTWAGISLHKGSVLCCSWIGLPYSGVYKLHFVLAVRLLRVQCILVSIVTNSHVIFFPRGSNKQARLLFSRAFRDSLFRGVYVMTNLQRWYCRFAFCWISIQREDQ